MQHPCNVWHAFLGNDDLIHIVEPLGNAMPYPLRWHTVDPATGKVVREELKHVWAISLDHLKHVYHAASQQGAATLGQGTIIVMEATTLAELNRLKAGPQLGLGSQAGASLMCFEWSPTGRMLATLWQDWHSDGSGVLNGTAYRNLASIKLHIYDTAAGTCMHSIQLPEKVKVRWSSSRDLVGVLGVPQDGGLYWNGRIWTPESDNGVRSCMVQVINPALQQAATMPCNSLSLEEGWQDFDWTPGGTLLIVKPQHSHGYFHGRPWGARVFDPCAAVLVWRLDSQDVAWGPVSSPEQAMTAFALKQSCLIKLSHAQAGWRAGETHMSEAEDSSGAALTPCGSTLVLREYIGLTKEFERLYHHALATQTQHTIAFGPECHPYVGWAPFARAWPQVYGVCELSDGALGTH